MENDSTYKGMRGEAVEHVLNIKSIVKRFSNFILGPIDFHTEPGVAVALVGPNGSGKSTFFRLIMQLLQPDQGNITVFGSDLHQEPTNSELKQQIGFAGAGLLSGYGHLTVRELAAMISRWYADWDHEYYRQLLYRYEITDGQTYSKSSTGTQKKIEFIFAMSHRPRLLLLDEPTAGVDMISQRKMGEDLLQYMEDENNSLVLATHLIADVKKICDYIYVLHKGRIISTFEKDDIHHQWGRLWLSDLPQHLQHHPHIVSIEDGTQVVTDDAEQLEQLLVTAGVSIEHREALELDEVIEYLIIK